MKDFIATPAPDAPQVEQPRARARKVDHSLIPERNYCAEDGCNAWLATSQYMCKRHMPAGY